MSSVHDFLFSLADLASDCLNPVFVALILEEPLLLSQARQLSGTPGKVLAPTLRFWGRSLVGIGLAVVLAELGKKYQIWPGHPAFPSGHTTLAAAAATCLILQRGRSWALLVIPLTLVMGASLIYGHWHTVDEVAAALILGPAITYGVWYLTGGTPRVS